MKKVSLFIAVLLISLLHVQGQLKRLVVAKDGTGNYKTIQEAISAVPDMRQKETVIFIKNGIYKEKLVLATSKRNVRFVGESVDKTILTYDDYYTKKNIFGEEVATAGSASFYIFGPGFSAENITFQNSSGPVGQALAVWVASDRSTFKNCRFLGFQDTIYTDYNARQYYKNCYIEGTTDFIFGPSTAVFEDCEIFCKKGGRYITAASTPDSVKYGYVFLNCRITGDAPPNSFYLGRPWRPFAKVVFIKSDLSNVIKSEGWNNWDKASNEKTAYYAEYKNRGEGFKPLERVFWSHQLTDDEAKEYTLTNIFHNWNPSKDIRE
ncbi:MAG: Pectinesterase [Segetibacter sp.]|nr:Pectinesterase [Segetibacter sp.]